MMTNHNTSGSSIFDDVAERQRRGLTLDVLFAILVALVMVISVAGFRAAGSDKPAHANATTTAEASIPASVGPGCVPDRTAWSDQRC